MGWLVVVLLQAGFLALCLIHLDGPFLSQHYERQNQTFDASRRIFHEGWSAVLTPKATFSLPGYETRPFTVIRQEFPFHGVLGWPLAGLLGHDAATVRLVSITFALLSIALMYLILRQWLAPGVAVAGAALWTASPLFLHLGHVPMPDILCTTGMLAAFWFALKSHLPASSAAFLFAVLAKLSVAVFGLPILVALLIARDCRKIGDFLRLSILWGWLPLLGLAAWLSLEIRDPDTPYSILRLSSRSFIDVILSLKFYVFLVGCLVPYGMGLLGVLGCLLALKNGGAGIHPWLKWAILAANLIYFVLVPAKIPEPQYLLPSLAWAVIGAALGFNYLAARLPTHAQWRWTVIVLAGVQLLTATWFTSHLEAPRVPGYPQFPQVAALLPPGARVILGFEHYGASPALWLDRNVLALHTVSALDAEWPQLQKAGFTHVLLMDVVTTYGSFPKYNLRQWFASFARFQSVASSGSNVSLTDYTGPSSPFRQYCDARFTPVFSGDHLVLYQLPAPAKPQ